MPVIEIINHCHSYSKVLCFQLSSLVLYKHPENLIYTLYTCKEDIKTLEVVDKFNKLLPNPINLVIQNENELRNRGIGRQLSLKTSKSDWLWFTDADYLFRENYLNNLHKILEENADNDDFNACHQRTVMASVNENYGDDVINSLNEIKVVDVDESKFTPTHYECAYGGLQVVRTSKCRDWNYTRRLETLDSWTRCFSDFHFRRTLGRNNVKIHKLEIPNLYRIRHNPKGREGGSISF